VDVVKNRNGHTHQIQIRLRCPERSILSRNDLIQLEGVIAKVLGGGTMEIECKNDITVRGVLSGRMKKHRIKVMVGDRVQVSVSPYDTTHGLITYRF
jgi:translation initiation factor IF-1